MRQTQLFLIEIPGEEEEESDDHCVQEVFEADTVAPCILVTALSGSNNFQTMRVNGVFGKQTLHILIDSRSTHNFLDLSLAKKLGLQLEPIATQAVTVADGNHLACQFICKEFKWRLHNFEFTSDMLLIPLGRCDMVLGVQWLSELGTVSWDFKRLVMQFDFKGVRHTLQGIPPKGVRTDVGSQKLFHQSIQLYFMLLVSIDSDHFNLVNCELNNHEVLDEVEEVLKEYADIFAEPTSLPPSIGVYDHRIPLEFGTNPINIRPYRYSLKQRDIIEKLVTEMEAHGIIQPSCNPFASPVVLVGKKDGSWRLCVDYRSLNQKTIKDRFPIPVVDELIDEPAGAQVFSKLDLRAGYHQLRVSQ